MSELTAYLVNEPLRWLGKRVPAGSLLRLTEEQAAEMGGLVSAIKVDAAMVADTADQAAALAAQDEGQQDDAGTGETDVLAGNVAEVVARLDGLDAEQLAQAKEFEAAGKARQGVLKAIDERLQALGGNE